MLRKIIKFNLLSFILILSVSLIGCGGGGGRDSPETMGDLATLSSNASMKDQPHYQCLTILPISYIQDNDTHKKEQIEGSLTLIYSRYTGEVPSRYSGYEIYKREISFNFTLVSDNSSFNSSGFTLSTELDDGEYMLGSQDEDTGQIVWEDEPVLSDFKTYGIGESYSSNSDSESDSATVLSKEYVTIGNFRYPAWKICEISSSEGYESEEYYWVNPEYGTLKMQGQMSFTDPEDNFVMYIDAVIEN